MKRRLRVVRRAYQIDSFDACVANGESSVTPSAPSGDRILRFGCAVLTDCLGNAPIVGLRRSALGQARSVKERF